MAGLCWNGRKLFFHKDLAHSADAVVGRDLYELNRIFNNDLVNFTDDDARRQQTLPTLRGRKLLIISSLSSEDLCAEFPDEL